MSSEVCRDTPRLVKVVDTHRFPEVKGPKFHFEVEKGGREGKQEKHL